MHFLEDISVGIKALFTNKLRSLLTMLGIIIGIASVLAMIAIGEGAKQIIIQDLEKIGGMNVLHLCASLPRRQEPQTALGQRTSI